MIFNVCASDTEEGRIYVVPLTEVLPEGTHYLGLSEGDWPRDAYAHWKISREEERARCLPDGKKHMEDYRAGIAGTMAFLSDADVSFPKEVPR